MKLQEQWNDERNGTLRKSHVSWDAVWLFLKDSLHWNLAAINVL